MTNNKEIDLLDYSQFKKVFLDERVRSTIFDIFLKPFTDITKEELEKAEYIIDENPEFIPKEEQPLINLYILMDEDRNITIETTTDIPHTMIKETSETFKKLAKKDFMNVKFLKIVLDRYNIFETDEPILNFKLRDQYGNEEDFWYESIYLVLDNCKKIADMANFKKDIVKIIKDLAEKYDFIKYYEINNELDDAIKKALEDEDHDKLKKLFTKMTDEGATVSMIASLTELSIEEVEKILNS